MFKRLSFIKNDEIDKEAAFNYIDNFLKESIWSQIYKDSLAVCMNEFEPHLAAIQERAQFTKDQCNIKAHAINLCWSVELAVVSCQLIISRP